MGCQAFRQVMTFNIRHGRALDGVNRWYKRRTWSSSVDQAVGPHVLGLQEVDPFQLDELLRRVPDIWRRSPTAATAD